MLHRGDERWKSLADQRLLYLVVCLCGCDAACRVEALRQGSLVSTPCVARSGSRQLHRASLSGEGRTGPDLRASVGRVEFTGTMLEAGTGGGVGVFSQRVVRSTGVWSFLLASHALVQQLDRARLRLCNPLSRIPNRDLSRAPTLSRFDTAEPVEVADWGGTSGGC